MQMVGLPNEQDTMTWPASVPLTAVWSVGMRRWIFSWPGDSIIVCEWSCCYKYRHRGQVKQIAAKNSHNEVGEANFFPPVRSRKTLQHATGRKHMSYPSGLCVSASSNVWNENIAAKLSSWAEYGQLNMPHLKSKASLENLRPISLRYTYVNPQKLNETLAVILEIPGDTQEPGGQQSACWATSCAALQWTIGKEHFPFLGSPLACRQLFSSIRYPYISVCSARKGLN